MRTTPRNRRSMSVTRSRQIELQGRIDGEEFTNRHDLLSHIATTDLTITRHGQAIWD